MQGILFWHDLPSLSCLHLLPHYLCRWCLASSPFFRLRTFNAQVPDVLPSFTGSFQQGILIFSIVAAITVILARIRMKRYMLSVSDIVWEVETKPKYDLTYFELIIYFFPLFYPPRRFMLCKHGILMRRISLRYADPF